MPPPVTCRAVLTDIEGTTSTIAFVHDVLFPYADAQLDAYVGAHRSEPAVAGAMRAAAAEAGLEPDTDDATIVAHLHRWIAEDRKSTPLKALQGLIWAEGFARGGFRAHVYADAADALRRWHAAGLTLAIYSSGSIEAQKTLFRHTEFGDLTPLFAGYFDTTTGPKREPASYTAIAAALRLAPFDVLFLSDVDAELDAAHSAGMATIRLLRPADTPPGAQTRHPAAATFAAIDVRPA